MITTRRTNRYTVTYDRYTSSIINQNSSQFINEDGNFTITAQSTLEEKVEFMLEQNLLRLDMELVQWWKKGMDQPINLSADIYRAFIMNFWNRQINQQTIDLHRVKLHSFFAARKHQLITRMMAYTQYQLQDQAEDEHSGDGGTTTTVLGRSADSTVPENQVDVDVASTNMPYADSFVKSKQDTTVKHNGTDTNTNTKTRDNDMFKFISVGSELQFLFDEAIKQDLFL